MSVPPELMNLVAGGSGQGGPPPQPGMQGDQPPGGSPMSTPEPARGDQQSAMVNVSIAMDLLEQALPALGSESEEGRVVLTCLSNLSKKFGAQRPGAQELVPAELMQLMSSMPGGMQGGMGGMPGGPPGGGAPGGMPSGPPGGGQQMPMNA